MKDQWEGMDRPPNPNAERDWLSQLLTYQGSWGPSLWAGDQGQMNQGEYTLYNPASAQSPYRDSGLPGTYRSADTNRNTFSAGPAMGTPGAMGATSGATGAGGGTAMSATVPSAMYLNPAGFASGAGMPSALTGTGATGAAAGGGGLAGLLSKLSPKDWAALAMGIGPLAIGAVGRQGELPYGSELERLLAELTKQQQEADPLRRATLGWAQGLVPTRG